MRFARLVICLFSLPLLLNQFLCSTYYTLFRKVILRSLGGCFGSPFLLFYIPLTIPYNSSITVLPSITHLIYSQHLSIILSLRPFQTFMLTVAFYLFTVLSCLHIFSFSVLFFSSFIFFAFLQFFSIFLLVVISVKQQKE